MSLLDDVEKEQLRDDLPDIRVGDSVRVDVRITEGEKERIQAFEGVVIRLRRGGPRATVTVRKVSYGVGVERIFPLHSPVIAGITIKSHAHVRRAKLYYLRDRKGKAARLKETRRAAGGKGKRAGGSRGG